MKPISLTATGVIIATEDARALARVVFGAADLANRHGMVLPAHILALASDLHSAAGTTERPAPAIENTVEYEQIDTTAAADILGCSPRNVRALAARDRLPGVKNGGHWWFNREDVEVLRDFRR